VCRERGAPKLALYGSGLTKSKLTASPDNLINPDPGAFILAEGELELNKDRDAIELEVTNMGDRPVQVGSHYPFFETNAKLQFDREKSFGYRLNIPAGTAVRFEPGERKRVQLVALAGERKVYGGNNLIDGSLDEASKAEAVAKMKSAGFLHQ